MLATRLTQKLGLAHPIVSAPMALAGGGKLAAAVSEAGGLGMIGGGYCDKAWVSEQLDIAEAEQRHNEQGALNVGCGFITWALAKTPGLLADVLERQPRAVMLSFGDPAPFAQQIADAGVPLICQVRWPIKCRILFIALLRLLPVGDSDGPTGSNV